MRRFWAALLFYTALPLGQTGELQFEGIAAWLPAVGLLLGGILLLASLLLQVFPPGVRAALLVALWVVLTGGLHLDGVADTADGLAVNIHKSWANPEQFTRNAHRLQVMSDSHTGAYGVLALGLVLLLKFAALSSLQVWPLLLVVPAWGRWGQLLAIAFYPYLREQGSARFLKDSTSWPRSLWPGTLLLLVTTAALGGTGILAWRPLLLWTLGSALGALAVGHWLYRQLGGHTGDTYGATVEWSETIALLWGSLLPPS